MLHVDQYDDVPAVHVNKVLQKWVHRETTLSLLVARSSVTDRSLGDSKKKKKKEI